MKRSLVILVTVLAACGGGATPSATSPTGSHGPSPTGTSPKAYVAAVCGAVLGWVDSVNALSGSLPAQLSSAHSAKKTKRIFTDYLHRVVQDTDAMVAQAKAAGAPAVANGQDVHRKLTETLDTIRTSFAEAEAKGKKLSTNDPVALAKGIEQVERDLSSELLGVEDILAFSDSADLALAAGSEPSCQKPG